MFSIRSLIELTLEKRKPRIIGVSGGMGKTSTIRMIEKILRADGLSCASMPSGDYGLGSIERALLGFSSKVSRPTMYVLSLLRLIFRWRYPENILIEYPLLGSADLAKRLSFAKPDTLLLNGVGDFPPNVELYETREAMLEDIKDLIESLGSKGLVIFNSDDRALKDIIKGTSVRAFTFGFEGEPDVMVNNFENKNENGSPGGISFKLEHDGSFVPIRINGVSGRFYAYAAAGAVAFGISRGLNLVKASEVVSAFSGEAGKGRIIPGIKETLIIDETYNSSLWGAINALEVLENLPSSRKIAVLGDILGLGQYTELAHIEMGKVAGGIADVIVTVGARGKFIAQGAALTPGKKNEILSFDDSKEAMQKVQDIIKPGDVVLVKGSKYMRMEEIVLEIMAEPLMAKDILVRR